MITSYETGAVFKLLDEFSGPLRKLFEGLDAAGKKSTELQAKLDKLGLGGVVSKMRGEWSEMDRDASAGVDKILKTMARLGPDTGAIFGEMTKGAKASFGEIGTSATGLSSEVVGTFGVLRSKAVAELGGIGVATPEAFASIDLAATGLSSDVLTRFAGLKTGAIAELQGIGTAAPEALGGVLTAAVAMQSDVLAEMRATATGSIEALRGIGAEAPGLFTPIVSEAATAANGAIAELARVNEAVRASVAGMAGLTAEANAVAMGASTIGTAVASLPSAAKGGVIQDAEAAAGSGGGVGRARHGGPHFGRVGTEIPGGHASLGGGPAMAAAGVIGYGVYEAAEMRDETNRLMITGQVDAEKWGATREQLGKLLMDSASLTGFSVKQVGEALSKSERAMSGLDVQTKMSVTKELIPYAAAEARLKETSLAESLQAMVGLAHMTGVYEPDKIRDLARKFSYVSLSTNSSLPQFENIAMAIDAHSTTAPADHRALLRTWAGAVPVPTPALTAETVAMLDAIPADVPHGGAPMTRYHGAPICSAASLRHRRANCGSRLRQRPPHAPRPGGCPRPRDGVVSRPRASQAHAARLRAARPGRDRQRPRHCHRHTRRPGRAGRGPRGRRHGRTLARLDRRQADPVRQPRRP